ncbi:hypothetical protein [Acetanaerobacterium elongatum]|uniref:Uncharacterized protein n=1 Tax=Acetanaerobacterium elongatum TaxID=258515 RepID=A0A1G9Z3D9_9FIRM|nr:hypothetical protein [Acetanaerobacterium elongatum]SDN15717.1 hypothetical protein SAMN05192585_11275 [Acetanaerobacterium elongatum]
MPSEVLVAIIAFAGTAVGSVGGVLASSRLVNFRLDKIEDKLDKHNHFGDRLTRVETILDIKEEN